MQPAGGHPALQLPEEVLCLLAGAGQKPIRHPLPLIERVLVRGCCSCLLCCSDRLGVQNDAAHATMQDLQQAVHMLPPCCRRCRRCRRSCRMAGQAPAPQRTDMHIGSLLHGTTSQALVDFNHYTACTKANGMSQWVL